MNVGKANELLRCTHVRVRRRIRIPCCQPVTSSRNISDGFHKHWLAFQPLYFCITVAMPVHFKPETVHVNACAGFLEYD